MAVATELTYNGPGATLAKYNQLLQQWECPGGTSPGSGLSLPLDRRNPSALRVADVWTSRPQFDEFVEHTIGPIAQQLGIPDPSRVNETQVANFLTWRPAASNPADSTIGTRGRAASRSSRYATPSHARPSLILR
jgi:hypothetical protein